MADIYLPGDCLSSGKTFDTASIKVDGSGNSMTANKTYVPKCGDLVVGVIKHRYAEHYSVDINAAYEAILDSTAFPQATKRNKPNLLPGCLIYCCVIKADKDFEFEVTCDLPEDKKGWMTGGNYLGVLTGGCSTIVTPTHAQDLQREENVLLPSIGELTAFQVAIGVNGRIWMETDNLKTLIKLKQAIESSENKKGVVQAAIARALFTASDE